MTEPMAPLHRVARQLPLALGLIAGLAACATPIASPLTHSTAPTDTVISPSPTPVATASPSGSSPGPGRPYNATGVLQAMRDSRRPGGVPDQLETRAVAAAVANELWTWDGNPWPELVIGGACGPSSCSLEVAGAPQGAGTDLYSIELQRDGTLAGVSSDLHGYPPALDSDLQGIVEDQARDLVDDMAFTSARWLPPPDGGRYWVAYRSGGEEGSPGLDLLVDLARGTVLDHRRR
jgi:hypothetical protein